ncbi:MAG: tetraacyldisaccharide 4'-kinase [Candidatus Omnitrophica bacterium]|nr:tetraacyldisaccharide 4'-kinase [Candidatus Omnitrophota bacterium]
MKKIIGSFLSGIYYAALVVSQASYRWLPFRIRKVPAKVISIGNLTWGGTGKTPLVVKLARDMAYYGKKVAVLVRGYGKDEVAELKKNLPNIPVIVGKNRARSARQAIRRHGAEVLILDDGFQHIRLHRDLDIVNINSVLPFGNGKLIPQGILREPVAHLRRAHLFVLTKSNIGSKNVHWIRQKLLEVKPHAPIFEAVHKPMRFLDALKGRTVTLGEMKGRRVATLSGIGDPYSFEKTVENLGNEIVLAARFDDHHAYTRRELGDFFDRCRKAGVREIVTTEKDFFRIDPLIKNEKRPNREGLSILVLQIEFQVHDEEDFLRRCLNP